MDISRKSGGKPPFLTFEVAVTALKKER